MKSVVSVVEDSHLDRQAAAIERPWSSAKVRPLIGTARLGAPPSAASVRARQSASATTLPCAARPAAGTVVLSGVWLPGPKEACA